MTGSPTDRRTAGSRRRQRGQVLVIVALAGLAVMAIAGLALDGGFEAGKYRQAQNATDAGSLAASRLVFAGANSGQALTLSDLENAAVGEISHNRAVAGTALKRSDAITALLGVTDAEAAGLTGQPVLNSNWQLQRGSNFSAESRIADLSAVATSTVTSQVGHTKLSGTAWSSSSAASASGQVETAYVNAVPPVGSSSSTDIDCQASSSSGPTSSCSGGPLSTLATLIAPMALTLTLGATPNEETTARVSIQGDPIVSNQYSATTLSPTEGPIALSAPAVTSASRLTPVGGTYPLGGYLDEAETVLTTANVTVTGITTTVQFSAGSATSGIRLYNNLAKGWTTCGASSSVQVTVTGSAPVTRTLNPDCSLSSSLGSLPAGVTVQPNYAVTVPGCGSDGQPSPNTGVLCQGSICIIYISVPTTASQNSTICVGKVSASMDVYQPPQPAPSSLPLTQPATGTQAASAGQPAVSGFVQGWQATANVPTTTVFLSILGWMQTHPTATATARIFSVADESDAAFAAAPYAMPDVAVRQDGAAVLEPLTVGHQYYLYGPLMTTYSPVAVFGSNWKGQVTVAAGHGFGSVLSVDCCGSASGPSYYPGGGSYYLLPVVSQLGVVEYYAEFLPVAGNARLGTLVNSVPSSGGHLVQATPGGGWQPDVPGAALIKITQ
jgi:hypothetical protein